MSYCFALLYRIFPFLPKTITLLSSKEQLEKAVQEVREFVQLWDLCVLIFFGWCFQSIILHSYPNVAFLLSSNTFCKKKSDNCAYHTWGNLIDLFCQAVRISALIYVIELIMIILSSLELFTLMEKDVQHLMVTFIGKVIYTVWITYHIKAWKKFILFRFVKRGLASLLDHVANFIIYFLMMILIKNHIKELQQHIHDQCDNGDDTLASIFAFGSLGTLFFSLTNKELVSQIVSGLLLSFSDKFHVGDWIRVGNKGSISGTVVKVGWIETEIQGFDEICIKIPNSEFIKEKVRNVSRTVKSQVKLTLYFKSQIMMKIPTFLKDVKMEIQKSCPEIISDGSKPFRVVWKDVRDDRLEVMVDCHFKIPRKKAERYWQNRQHVLMCVAKVMEEHQVEFAPPYPISTSDRNNCDNDSDN